MLDFVMKSTKAIHDQRKLGEFMKGNENKRSDQKQRSNPFSQERSETDDQAKMWPSNESWEL